MYIHVILVLDVGLMVRASQPRVSYVLHYLQDSEASSNGAEAMTAAAASMGLPADPSHQVINRRCKRKKRHLLEAAA